MDEEETPNNFLYLRLVEFITTGNRVFRCEWPSTWVDFHSVFPQHYDLSSDFIKDEFFQKVLPYILDFELSPEQNRCVKLFDDYPGVTKTARGYRLLTNAETLQQKLNTTVVEGKHYVRYEQVEDSLDSIPAILIGTVDFYYLKRKYCNDANIQTWCSALLSTEDEMMKEVLLPYEKIKARLLRIKDRLRITGTLRTYLDYKRVENNLKRHKEFKMEAQQWAMEKDIQKRYVSSGQ